MDPPRNQVLEVHLPIGHPASFFSLPGECVLESPTVTMHIQRSVLSQRPTWDGHSIETKK
ncbi:MAG: hypothetical protein WBR10_16975 [Candidatus Acidiferrum sp.]